MSIDILAVFVVFIMLTATEAERLIFALIDPLTAVETIPVSEGLGRVLASDVASGLDFPHWDNSAMDGYAVRSSDFEGLQPQTDGPLQLAVVEEISAGQKPKRAIGPGQAARIFTGAMMPEGADTVVMQEDTEQQPVDKAEKQTDSPEKAVYIHKFPTPRAFVRKQGSFRRAGERLLPAGRSLSAAEVALLAAAQQSQISVFQRPKVAILSTGNELVTPGQLLAPGQIVDSNQYALAALVAQAGAVPVPLGIVSDQPETVRAAIATALSRADMVISSGGVSVGDYDYVEQVLESLGGQLHVRSVAVKPGKPLTVAGFSRREVTSLRQVYFGLPGNPASAMVGFWRFVGPAIAKLSGRVGPWRPEFVWAKATNELRASGQRETYLWGQLVLGLQGYEFGRAVGSHSSGNLVNLADVSGLGVVPQGETLIEPGARVQVLRVR